MSDWGHRLSDLFEQDYELSPGKTTRPFEQLTPSRSADAKSPKGDIDQRPCLSHVCRILLISLRLGICTEGSFLQLVREVENSLPDFSYWWWSSKMTSWHWYMNAFGIALRLL